MIDRKPAPQTALVLSPQYPGTDANRAQARLEEAIGLAQALDLVTAEARIEPLRRVESSGFFGTGKIAQIAERVKDAEITVVIIDAGIVSVAGSTLLWGKELVLMSRVQIFTKSVAIDPGGH